MKTFTFRYDPYPARSAVEGIQKTLRTGKGEVQSDSISYRNMEEMMRLLTRSRLDAFSAIIEQEPGSLTELAKVLGKDPGNVQRDVVALQSLGLVEMKRVAAKRGVKLKPVALYRRIVIECEPKRVRKAMPYR